MITYISKLTGARVAEHEIRDAYNAGKVPLIKLYRSFTSKGLKDSKDAIESVPNSLNAIYELFRRQSKEQNIDIEQFKNMVCNAIDKFDDLYFEDYCKGLLVLAQNLQDRGGMERLIRETDEFMNGLK